jgi:hypothetical protein
VEAVWGIAQPLARTLGLLTSRFGTTLSDIAVLDSFPAAALGDSGAHYYWNAPGNTVLLDHLVGWWVIWPSLATRNGAMVRAAGDFGDQSTRGRSQPELPAAFSNGLNCGFDPRRQRCGECSRCVGSEFHRLETPGRPAPRRAMGLA